MGENKRGFESLVFEWWRLCCSSYGSGKAREACVVGTTVPLRCAKSFCSSLPLMKSHVFFSFWWKITLFMYTYQSILRIFSSLLRPSGFICLLLFRYRASFPAALLLPFPISWFFCFPFCTFARNEKWLKISTIQKKKWKKKIKKKSRYCSLYYMYIIFKKESIGT